MGSSPLARGLLDRCCPRRGDRGIIPARAGFATKGKCAGSTPWDHPRSRGVYDTAWDEMMDGWGSSPLARGLPGCYHRRGRACGIIPARAGFTDKHRGPQAGCGDHPRSRGVYLVAQVVSVCASGSSPLARGLRIDVPAIILYILDHPRSRGVYTRYAYERTGRTGSSPLARGLRDRPHRRAD